MLLRASHKAIHCLTVKPFDSSDKGGENPQLPLVLGFYFCLSQNVKNQSSDLPWW